MKKILLIIICVWSCLCGPEGRAAKPLANENKDGLYVRSLEQVLRLDANEVDLATAVLIGSEQWSETAQGRRYLWELDDMALEIRRRLEDKGFPVNHKAIEVINKYLFEELGFAAISDAKDPNDLFLHTVMDGKRGYCLSLSVLYLSIGERLGLPLYGVVVPGHFFVRYDNGKVRFNIETTSKGGYASDEHYISKFKVPKSDGSIYMANLNKIQTLGCFFNNLGNVYNDVGDREQAMLFLERAAEINPSLAESHLNLGNIYLDKNRIKDAIREYEAALEIDAGSAKTYNNLGNAYTKDKRLGNAVLQYIQAISLDANFVEAYKNLANVYCEQQKFGLAAAQLRRAMDLKPEDPNIYGQLGDVYTRMGDYKRGISQYRKAVLIKRNFADAYYGMAFCYNKMALTDEEVKAYKKALEIKPDMTAALVGLGNVHFRRQDYGAAIEEYKKAVLISPGDSAIYYNLGAAYSNGGQFEEAAAEYEKAIEINPRMGDAHNGLAFALYRLEKYDLAWRHINKAKELGADVAKDLLEAIKDKVR